MGLIREDKVRIANLLPPKISPWITRKSHCGKCLISEFLKVMALDSAHIFPANISFQLIFPIVSMS